MILRCLKNGLNLESRLNRNHKVYLFTLPAQFDLQPQVSQTWAKKITISHFDMGPSLQTGLASALFRNILPFSLPTSMLTPHKLLQIWLESSIHFFLTTTYFILWVTPHNMQDLSSLARNQTCIPSSGGRVSAAGLPGNPSVSFSVPVEFSIPSLGCHWTQMAV